MFVSSKNSLNKKCIIRKRFHNNHSHVQLHGIAKDKRINISPSRFLPMESSTEIITVKKQTHTIHS